MRYSLDDSQSYFNSYRIPSLFRLCARRMLHHIRMWDRLAADRVDNYLTNSHYVRKRIYKYYRRDAHLIYPPVDTTRFPFDEKPGKYFLAVGRLTPYKKFYLLVEAFNELKEPL